jgi:hypothetical protein
MRVVLFLSKLPDPTIAVWVNADKSKANSTIPYGCSPETKIQFEPWRELFSKAIYNIYWKKVQ